MLCQAASETGGLAIQNRGTLGGNIVNASPAADSPPALLAYDAEVELVSTQGSRWLPYHGFHTGYKQMLIRPDELLTRIRLPRNTTGATHYYRKVGTRKAQAISKVCFAAVGRTNNGHIEDARVVVGSVAPIVVRCLQTESSLRGQKPGAATAQSKRRFAPRPTPSSANRRSCASPTTTPRASRPSPSGARGTSRGADLYAPLMREGRLPYRSLTRLAPNP